MSIKFYCADIPNQSKALEIAKKLSTTLEFDNTKRNESEITKPTIRKWLYHSQLFLPPLMDPWFLASKEKRR